MSTTKKRKRTGNYDKASSAKHIKLIAVEEADIPLCHDVWFQILGYLTIKQLLVHSIVCHKFKNILVETALRRRTSIDLGALEGIDRQTFGKLAAKFVGLKRIIYRRVRSLDVLQYIIAGVPPRFARDFIKAVFTTWCRNLNHYKTGQLSIFITLFEPDFLDFYVEDPQLFENVLLPCNAENKAFYALSRATNLETLMIQQGWTSSRIEDNKAYKFNTTGSLSAPKLKRLRIGGIDEFQNGAFPFFTDLRRLEHLEITELWRDAIPADFWKTISADCKNLQTLTLLTLRGLTDNELQCIPTTMLRRVDIEYCHTLSSVGISKFLNRCNALEHLTLDFGDNFEGGEPAFVEYLASNITPHATDNQRLALYTYIIDFYLTNDDDRELLSESLKPINTLLQFYPNHIGTLAKKASVYCTLKQFEEAEILTRTILDADPDNISAWKTRAKCYEKTHEYNAAIECYSKILKGSHDWINKLLNLILSEKMRRSRIKRDKCLSVENVTRYCEAAAKANCADSRLFTIAALYFIQHDDPKDAHNMVERALAINPTDRYAIVVKLVCGYIKGAWYVDAQTPEIDASILYGLQDYYTKDLKLISLFETVIELEYKRKYTGNDLDLHMKMLQACCMEAV